LKYTVQGKQLQVASGVTREFTFDIKEALAIEGVIVIVLNVPAGHFMTENVFGVSEHGDLLWQIEAIPETSTDEGNFYVGISGSGTRSVRLANWNDMVVDVDVKTGKILSKRQGRFT
jgi:hypothetical protein